MNPAVNEIGNRLSLRAPQRRSLEILARLCEIMPFEKETNPAEALQTLQSEYPQVADFEREFPSLCFALATGVGKTRLMGAFMAYLARTEGVRHFLVLAPNLTIYNKLVTDFTPNTPKYVFWGIREFAMTPPELITGDNYESGRGIRAGKLLDDDGVHINVFNISKINSEVRGDKAPRIKRLSEYIGESYFEYLSKLDDLVLLMDESHRYRATAGVKAINELRPILGLELTATPQVEKGSKSEPFKNVIYSYPLAEALHDGFVKEPAVATRENFDVKNYTKESLETLKLEDGIHVHEETKTQLELYARERNLRRVKPFMLVVAEDTTHAAHLKAQLEAPTFFGGQYAGRVLEVHSNKQGVEKDETVQQLLSVEDPANPVEIVIHVNMLKEGWDVTNLYTIVPLRAANSKTLVEQSIGRGLRLPYGKRTGVPAVDRLTIVSHDRFQDIIDEANRPESIIRSGVIVGRDVPLERTQVVVAPTRVQEQVLGGPTAAGEAGLPLFANEDERKIAQTTLEVLRQFERLPSSRDLKNPEVAPQVVARVLDALRSQQGYLPGILDEDVIKRVVATTVDVRNQLSIDIPRMQVIPVEETPGGFRSFTLDCQAVRLQPVSDEILIQQLKDQERYRLQTGETSVPETRLEDYLVRGLMDFDDVDYMTCADLLYDLAGQMVRHLQSYLRDDEKVRNVLQGHQHKLVQLIHTQMEDHYEEPTASDYQVTLMKGFVTLRDNNYSLMASDRIRHYRDTVDDKLLIRGMLFSGFGKSMYSVLKFDSNAERVFAIIVEADPTVEKWLKPAEGHLNLMYDSHHEYVPDFVVETVAMRYLCEPKAANQMRDDVVLAKAKAARVWCERATELAGGKPWKYLLIPHDALDESQTLASLAQRYEFAG